MGCHAWPPGALASIVPSVPSVRYLWIDGYRRVCRASSEAGDQVNGTKSQGGDAGRRASARPSAKPATPAAHRRGSVQRSLFRVDMGTPCTTIGTAALVS